MSEKRPPIPPISPMDNAECPECGDEAFPVDEAEEGLPDEFSFSCDSCGYIVSYPLEFPEELMAIAKTIRFRP